MPLPSDSPSRTARTGSRLDTIDRKDAAAVCKAYDKLEVQYEQALRSNDITVQDYIEQVTYLEKKNGAMAETIKKLELDKSLSEYERAEIKRLYSCSQEKYQRKIQRLMRFDSNLLSEIAAEKQERTQEKQEYEAEIARLEEKVRFLTQKLEMLQAMKGHPTQPNKSEIPNEPDCPAIVRAVRSPMSLEISITKGEIKKEPKAATQSVQLVRKQQVEDDGGLSYRSFFLPNGEIDHEAAIRYGQEEMERERRREREVSEQAGSISESQTTTEDVTNAYMAVAARMAAASRSSQASNAYISEAGVDGEHAEDAQGEVNETIIKSKDISVFVQTVPTMEDHFDDASDELYANQASDGEETAVNHAQKHGSSPPVSPDNKRARPSENEVLFNGKDFLRDFNREYNVRYGLPSDYMVNEDSMIANSDKEEDMYKFPARDPDGMYAPTPDNYRLLTISPAAEVSHRDDDYVAEDEHVLNGFRRRNDPEVDSELHRVSVEPLEDDAEGPMSEQHQEEDDLISSHGAALVDNDHVEVDSTEELDDALQDPLLQLSKLEPEAAELSEEDLHNVSATGDDSFGRPVATSSPPSRKTEDITPVHSFIQSEDPIRQAKVQELMRKNLVAFNVRKPSKMIDSRTVAEEAKYDAGNEADVEDLRKTTSEGKTITIRAVPTEQEMAQVVADTIASGKTRRVQSHAPGCWVIDENSSGSAGDIDTQTVQSLDENEDIKVEGTTLDTFHMPSMLVPEPRIVTSSEEDSSESTKRGSPSPGITDSDVGVPVSNFLDSLGNGTTAASDLVAQAKPTTPIKVKPATDSETNSPASPPSAEDKVTIDGVMLDPENHNPWEGKLQPHNLDQIREVSLRNIPEDVTLTQVLENMKFGIIDRIYYDKSDGTVSVFYVEPVAAKACYTYLHRFGNWVKTTNPGPTHMEVQTMLDLNAFLWSGQSLPISQDMLNLVKHGEVTRVIFVTGLPYHFTDNDVKRHILSVSPPDTELDKVVESVQKIRSHVEIRFTSIKECLRVKQALKALPEYTHGPTLFGPDTCGGLQGQLQLLTKKFMKFRGGPQHVRYSSPESPNTSGSTLLMELTRGEGETPLKPKTESKTTAQTGVPVVEAQAPGSPESLKFADIDGLQQAAALKHAASLDMQPKPSSQTASPNTVAPKSPTAPKAMVNAPGPVRFGMPSLPAKNTTSQPGSRAVSFATTPITHNIEAVMPPEKAATWAPPPAEGQTYCIPTAHPRVPDPESMLEKSQGPAKLRPTLPTFKRPGTPAPKTTRLPSSKPIVQRASGVHPAAASFASVAARAPPAAQVQGTESSFDERRGPVHVKPGPTNTPYAGFQNAEPSSPVPASPKVVENVRTNEASVAENLLPPTTIENMKKFTGSTRGLIAQKTTDKPLGAKHWATQESIAIAAYRQATIKSKEEIRIPEARTLDFKVPDQYTETFHPRAVRLTNLPPEWGYDDLATYVRGGAVDTMAFVSVSPPPTLARIGPPPGKAAVIIFVLQLAAEKFRAFIIKERVTPRPGYILNADANLGVVPGVCVYSPEKVLRQELTRCLTIEGLPHGCNVEKLKNAINKLPANGEEMRFESIKVNGVCAWIACTCISDAVFIMRNINRAKGYLGVRVQYAPDPCDGELWGMGRKNA